MTRAVAAALLVAALAGCEAEVTSSQSAVEERLTCQCGCGLTVHTCNHLQCSFAVPVKEDIARSLAAGETPEEILDRYVAEYGEKVLSSPTPRGFNLLAWYGPYLAVLAGVVLIVWAMRRWRPSRAAGEEEGPAAAGLSEEERKRLERELEDTRP